MGWGLITRATASGFCRNRRYIALSLPLDGKTRNQVQCDTPRTPENTGNNAQRSPPPLLPLPPEHQQKQGCPCLNTNCLGVCRPTLMTLAASAECSAVCWASLLMRDDRCHCNRGRRALLIPADSRGNFSEWVESTPQEMLANQTASFGLRIGACSFSRGRSASK